MGNYFYNQTNLNFSRVHVTGISNSTAKKNSIQEKAFSVEGDELFSRFMAGLKYPVAGKKFVCKDLNSNFWDLLSRLQKIIIGIRFSNAVDMKLMPGVVKINPEKKARRNIK